MDIYKELFERIDKLKQIGGLEEALKFLYSMKEKKLSGVANRIQLEILKIEFQLGCYEEALIHAINGLSEDDGCVTNWIIDNYYIPYKDDYKKILDANISYFNEYEFFYGNLEWNNKEVLWYDDNGPLIFRKGNEIIVLRDQFNVDTSKINIVMNAVNLKRFIHNLAKEEILYRKNPIYLYYDQDIFDAFSQCIYFEELLDKDRIVILVGENNVREFFKNDQVKWPEWYIGEGQIDLNHIFEQLDKERRENDRRIKEQIIEYYEKSSHEINERIKIGKPRILFFTSYFTITLKYHTRDCRKVAQKMGLETELLIEEKPIFVISYSHIFKKVNQFRPDIIFCIDHFRFEGIFWPKQIVWITWIQDMLPYVVDANTPAKLGKRDFIMNHFTTWREFRKIGYQQSNLIEAPIPASSDIYKVYNLTKEEYDQYICDICFVCHASDVESHMNNFVKESRLPDKYAQMVQEIYRGYHSYVYESGDFFYNKDLFTEFVFNSFIQIYNIQLNANILQFIADDMFNNFNQRVYRQVLVDWILDAGFTNLKLWGNGWKDSPKYKQYAMGPAENGETLSKIYQASRIVVGNNVMTTAAARAWETMLSGGFYLSNYIPEEDDVTDIRKIIEVGKDVIMFYNKEDLIQKLHYYLDYEDERQAMIELGRKAALENMTFDILMKRSLSEVANRLEKDEDD